MAAGTPRKAHHISKKLTGELAHLGLALDHDGLVTLHMLTGASGDGFSVQKDQEHRCEPEMAARFTRMGIARQGHARP
jgi:hypothetical protein